MINEEVDYLSTVRDLKLIPGAAEAIARLRRAGFKIVVVSNQSGVARGYFSLRRLSEINAALRRRLAAKGARLDALHVCPHHPEGSVARYSRRCACRKPGTALFRKAARGLNISLKDRYMVGDATADVAAGRKAGCRTVLVRTGKGGRDGRFKAAPHLRAKDLADAAAKILREAGE